MPNNVNCVFQYILPHPRCGKVWKLHAKWAKIPAKSASTSEIHLVQISAAALGGVCSLWGFLVVSKFSNFTRFPDKNTDDFSLSVKIMLLLCHSCFKTPPPVSWVSFFGRAWKFSTDTVQDPGSRTNWTGWLLIFHTKVLQEKMLVPDLGPVEISCPALVTG